ncbi:hypothetical protein [Amycolatopsis sp. NPDC004378]
MSKKLALAGSVLAATAALAGTGVATASPQATNPNTCVAPAGQLITQCGTNSSGAPGGRTTVWCDWSGGPAASFDKQLNGLWYHYPANGANSGTVNCGTTSDLASTVHVQVTFSRGVSVIKVGWHV